VRPLDPLSSIKMKLGVVIVAAVAVTVGVVAVGNRADVPLLVLAVVAGLLALAMVQFLAQGMTSPLRAMASAAAAMARGDYDRHVTATSRDEVGELARAFNKMAAELAEVDRMRRDLIANVSHELRTPISALQAVLENLVDGIETADEAQLRVMLQQVERLGRLVAQLLDLSRLESGAIPLQRTVFEVGPVLEQAIQESRLLLERRNGTGVQLSMMVEPETLELEGDPERVHQVVTNLLENAVRHSPPGGRVVLGAHGAADAVTIEVVDEGPGIQPSEASRVFERFYRSDAARSSDGGTGLGLSIARWIVDLHGGDIRAEQNFPHGCRMVVELPIAHETTR
jgi:signal transduction histidine kinase